MSDFLIEAVKFEDFMATLEANKERLSGLNLYGISVYAAGTKVAIRAYTPNLRGKELVGMDIVKADK